MTADFDSVAATVASCWAPSKWSQVGVVVGVSGGADSVCLLRVLKHLHDGSGSLTVAHYDHKTRESSHVDSAFVDSIASNLGLPIVSDSSKMNDASRSEAQLREERYSFLEATANRCGARYVVIAHNRNDQAETVMHNVLRGTGTSGLAGIPSFRAMGQDLVLARPMLGVSRSQIMAALQELKQPYREDPTNSDPKWTRNWLRHELLPVARSRFPEIESSLSRLSENVLEMQEAIDCWANRILDTAVIQGENEVTFTCEKIEDVPKSVLVRALQLTWIENQWPRGDMSREQWSRVATFLIDSANNGSPFHLPGEIHVSKSSHSVHFRRAKDSVL